MNGRAVLIVLGPGFGFVLGVVTLKCGGTRIVQAHQAGDAVLAPDRSPSSESLPAYSAPSRLAALNLEIDGLKAKVALLTQQIPSKKSKAEKHAIANEVFTTFTRQGDKGSAVDFLRAMELFHDLDEEAASVFVEKYKASLGRNE